MTTVTGKIESASGETLHAAITFTSLSTPQFPPTIVEVNTVKRVLSDPSTGLFSVALMPGNFLVTVTAKGLSTSFNIAVPEGDTTISIEELVTTTTAAIPGEAPYTLWNGQRAGHLTFLPIADPATPNVGPVDVAGSSMGTATYAYRVSCVTTAGETALSGINDNTVGLAPTQGLRVTFAAEAPTGTTARRIWRNLDSGDLTEFYLLAELAPAVAYYDDWEGHTAFALRAARPPTPPTYNTTAGIINSSAGVPQLYFSSTGLRALSNMAFDLVAQFNNSLQLTTGAVAGYVLTSDASGFGTWQAPAAGGAGLAASGSPEAAQTATPGTTYLNTTDETFWVKKTGSGNTGWIQLIGA